DDFLCSDSNASRFNECGCSITNWGKRFSLSIFECGWILVIFYWWNDIQLAFFLNSAPAIGWTGYAPLSTSMFTPDVNTDYYVFGVQVAGLGTILTALN